MRAAVEVWCVDLSSRDPLNPDDVRDLTAGERARVGRYLVPEPARVFARTRAALRALLGQRLDVDAAAVRIGASPRGKPVALDAPGLQFNVTHGSSLALIAFCDLAVGVDVESPDALTQQSALDESVCSPTELAWVRGQPSPREAALLRLWTRKEAVLKACGSGLARPPSTIDLGPPAATAGRVVVAGDGLVCWVDLALPWGDVGAVAVDADGVDGIDATLRHYAP